MSLGIQFILAPFLQDHCYRVCIHFAESCNEVFSRSFFNAFLKILIIWSKYNKKSGEVFLWKEKSTPIFSSFDFVFNLKTLLRGILQHRA